jgi:hypothetical protein
MSFPVTSTDIKEELPHKFNIPPSTGIIEYQVVLNTDIKKNKTTELLRNETQHTIEVTMRRWKQGTSI